MDSLVPLLFASVLGFTHAFEVDHLVAVSSLVTRRQSLTASLKDGVFWGLGHTSTILAVGAVMILLRVAISEQVFGYLEAGVGLMLVLLGLYRLRKLQQQEANHRRAHHAHAPHSHRLAYGVGLVHGLAGSGALVLLVMTQIKGSWESLAYLLIFGIGSIGGMLVASGVFCLPFSQKIGKNQRWQWTLSTFSALLCVAFGAKIMWEHLFAA